MLNLATEILYYTIFDNIKIKLSNSNPSPAATKKPWNLNGSRAFSLPRFKVFPYVFPYWLEIRLM